MKRSVLLALEVKCRQWGQAQRQRIFQSHPGHRLGHNSAAIAEIAAGVILSVAVEKFAIITRLGYSDTVVFAGYGREVCHDHYVILGISGAPNEREHAGVRVVTVDPLKTLPFEIHFMQGRFPTI